MRIFRIFKQPDLTQITTRNNKNNIYTKLVDAKTALKNFLRYQNRKKNIKISSDDCVIIEYDLQEKDVHRI